MKRKVILLISVMMLMGCASSNGSSSVISSSSSLDVSSSTESIQSSVVSSSESSVTENSSSSSVTSVSSEISSSSASQSVDVGELDDYSSHVPSHLITPKSEVDKYYSSISDSLSGENLRTALQKLTEGHTKLSYDNLEEYMRLADRDWSQSPSESDENPYMHLLYYTKNDDSEMHQTWNKYYSSKNPAGPQMWDKEHIWAKSNGFPSSGKMAYSDLHHLRASDKKNNNTRSNSPFAEVTTTTKSVVDFSNTASGKIGTCNGVTVYEPRDEDKGDIARALLYMATRYASSDGIKLSLTNGTDSSGGKWGFLSTLLKWNMEDLPDAFEIRRNDIIYEELQHNRNPFIDHPEYANRIYGNL